MGQVRRAALREGATPTNADEIAYVAGMKLVMRRYLNSLEAISTRSERVSAVRAIRSHGARCRDARATSTSPPPRS